jgi:hypothetical protein
MNDERDRERLRELETEFRVVVNLLVSVKDDPERLRAVVAWLASRYRDASTRRRE